MNPVIVQITLRQLLSRRRVILLLLLGGVLLLVAFIFRLGGDETQAQSFTAGLLSNLGLATLMPLVALILGTAAIGSELEDGTAVYLLAKPISRWTILFSKLVVVAAGSILLTCVPILLAGLLAAGGLGDGVVLAFTVAAAIGSVVYSAVFVAVSLVTSRALVFGLGYVLIWEGLLAGLFAGTRTFSVRQHTLAVADALTDATSSVFASAIELPAALIVGTVILVGAVLLAGRRLVDIEIAGETA